MLNYLVKRLIASIITLWVVVTATFFLMRLLPGGPFTSEKNISPAILKNLNAKFGLDKPVHIQYAMYIKNLLRGDLGPSMKFQGRTVNGIISTSFPASAKVGGISVIAAVAIGTWMGIISALNQGKWQDRTSMVFATFGVTVPSFVVATLLTYVFTVKLRWLPSIGLDGAKNYIMPVIALAGYSMAFIARLSRSSLLDVVRQDYIRTAKAKGLTQSVVTYKHALRNSLIPVVTYVGPLVAGVLTGSFVIEKIFGIPGLGREFVTSIGNRDYTLITGVTVFYGSFLIACNFIVDILYAVIDPRIKLEN